MKKCELCRTSRASIYCGADQASLCWDCDAMVHGANFLVARHSRTLLCHSCQAPTPWMASSAPKLAPSVSFCFRCCVFHDDDPQGEDQEDCQRSGNDDLEIDAEDEHSDDDDDVDIDVEEEDTDFDVVDDDGEADSQVVPWSSSPPPPPPPPPSASSSSSEDSSTRLSNGDSDDDDLKPWARCRVERPNRIDSNLGFQDDLDFLSSRRSVPANGEATPSVDSSEYRRIAEPDRAGSRSTAIFASLERFQDRALAAGDQASVVGEADC